MKTELKNEKLIIKLEGRIDSTNAPQVENELMEARNTAPEAEVIIDADNLEYISSAGLRVLMKLRKAEKKPVLVVNVSPQVYEIFEMTGFSELLDVRKKLREISIDGCELIGEGGNGKIYRLDQDTIVKVYRPHMEHEAIDQERDFARTAFINGIPSVIAYDVVRVKDTDSLGLVFEMLKSDTLGHAIATHPEKLNEYTDKYVELAKKLHNTHVNTGSFARIQDVLHLYADNLDKWCTAEEISIVHNIIDNIPEADTVTHNDLHPGNIMIQDEELLLIDMPAVTMGPPICDMIAIFRDMISAPKRSAEHIERSTGMPADLIFKTGNLFFMKYTGITDPAELEEYYKKLGLLYAFNVILMPGTGSNEAMKRADNIMNNLLRPIVIPNEQTICYLLKTM